MSFSDVLGNMSTSIKKTRHPGLRAQPKAKNLWHREAFRSKKVVVTLVVDLREKMALGTHLSRQMTPESFKFNKLELGDFLWVASLSSSSSRAPKEYVLNYIVERKRISDLKRGLKNGRHPVRHSLPPLR